MASTKSELKVGSIKGLDKDRAHNLIAVNEDVFIYWDESGKSLAAYQLDAGNKVLKKKVIGLTEAPGFIVTNLSLNWKGNGLALIGPEGLAFVDLPLNWDRIFLSDQQPSTPFNCTQLGKQIFYGQSLTNLQTRWHPTSDSHLIVLTSDNCFQVFDVLDSSEAIRSIPILKHANDDKTHGLNISSAVGEGVVSFDFGPALIKSVNCDDVPELANIFPLFSLTGDGDVYMLYFSLAEEHVSNRVFGPLPIKPMCDDDYGFDACSIMCVDHQATILVVGTLSGRIYHFLALEDDDECDKDYEFYTLNRTRISIPPLSLYLTDATRIDFTVLSAMSPSSDPVVGKNRFLTLFPHIFDPRRYYVVHCFGMHNVYINFMEQFFEDEDSDLMKKNMAKEVNTKAPTVEWLVASNFRKDTNLFPVGYAAAMKNGLCISVMFNNGKVVFKNCSLAQMSKLSRKDKPAGDEAKKKSPDGKSVLPTNDLTNSIQDILRRIASIPKFVGPDMDNNSQLTTKDLEVLKQVVGVFKNEYFAKFIVAKSLLESVWEAHNSSYHELLNRFESMEKRMQSIVVQFPVLLEKSQSILDKKAALNAQTLRVYNQIVQKSPAIMNMDGKLAKELREYSNKAPRYEHSIQSLKDNFAQLKKEIIKNRLKPAKPSNLDYGKICTLLNQHEKELEELRGFFDEGTNA